jgi:hypothetical protein
MIIPPIFSSAGAGTTSTRSPNGLMFIILCFFKLFVFKFALIVAKTVPKDLANRDKLTHWQKKIGGHDKSPPENMTING